MKMMALEAEQRGIEMANELFAGVCIDLFLSRHFHIEQYLDYGFQ
jgi:hypothetical protein